MASRLDHRTVGRTKLEDAGVILRVCLENRRQEAMPIEPLSSRELNKPVESRTPCARPVKRLVDAADPRL